MDVHSVTHNSHQVRTPGGPWAPEGLSLSACCLPWAILQGTAALACLVTRSRGRAGAHSSIYSPLVIRPNKL